MPRGGGRKHRTVEEEVVVVGWLMLCGDVVELGAGQTAQLSALE
jgi:hypothetical protein